MSSYVLPATHTGLPSTSLPSSAYAPWKTWELTSSVARRSWKNRGS